jgi:hypothetical protein
MAACAVGALSSTSGSKKNEQDVIITAPGVSCSAQSEHSTGYAAMHPIQLVERSLWRIVLVLTENVIRLTIKLFLL